MQNTLQTNKTSNIAFFSSAVVDSGHVELWSTAPIKENTNESQRHLNSKNKYYSARKKNANGMENKPATIQNDTVRVTTNKYMEGEG